MRFVGHVLNPPADVVQHASKKAAEDEERIASVSVMLPEVRLDLGEARLANRLRHAKRIETRPLPDAASCEPQEKRRLVHAGATRLRRGRSNRKNDGAFDVARAAAIPWPVMT